MANSPLLSPSVPKVALILTDGKSTSGIGLLHESAMYADRNNVYVMAIGVGDEVNLSPAELTNMTHGIKEHQQIIPYKELTKSLDNVVEQICYREFKFFVCHTLCCYFKHKITTRCNVIYMGLTVISVSQDGAVRTGGNAKTTLSNFV